jgi:hypothetical protein
MADTKTRWTCSCGSFRFKVAGVDKRTCQECGLITRLGTALWWWAGAEK